MSSLSYRSSSPDHWVQPRPYKDASLRLMANGPVQPMEDNSSFFSRLFGRG